MASIYGDFIKVSIFGQSHSEAIGVSIHNLPAGFEIDMEKLQSFLNRRAPGRSKYTTSRREEDIPEFISGLVGNRTCGAPLTAIIRNTNIISKDYDVIKDVPRPGHADYSAHIKYGGYEDYRGGGHFSGRLTAPLCIAGGIFIQILEEQKIEINSKILEIGGNAKEPYLEIERAMNDGDSVGGIVQCGIKGLRAGIGSPIFDGVENKISQAVFGIPGIKGIEFGEGFAIAKLKGSESKDEYYYEDGEIKTKTNNNGGILGGISNGMDIVFKVAVKPTPSISKEQDSISYSKGENTVLSVKGRHDPCIVPRILPCVEAAAAMAIFDLLMGECNVR
ncbi:chorismate synthase [Anaerosphaera multitolerans]|uniref:Chorismate synthase n=1 Tax=Anaerosphaera multitolerans TaxID=2487351 RepID=A0A437S6B7_9FIRM|nr:chorismate synthase [Anaerosphaera multitolerans]RVU54496.1 chorismate synthase [Anaerosphaera multitolerans]